MVIEAKDVYSIKAFSQRDKISDLPLQELASHCQREMDAFYRGMEYNDVYAKDLFQRAVLGKDEQARSWAWSFIFHLFSPLVLSWIMQDSRSTFLFRELGKDSLVNSVFAKFALALKRTPEKIIEFSSLGAILKYMKLTSRSVVVNELRRYMCKGRIFVDISEAIDVIGDKDPLEVIQVLEQTNALWSVIAEESHPQELLYLQLTFIEGLKPSEIIIGYSNVFKDVEEIYSIRHTVIDRLRRNPRLALYWATKHFDEFHLSG